MRGFREKLYYFMMGRNGVDQLNYGLFGLYFLIWIINLFVGWAIIQIIQTALLIFIIFRMFSRNLQARRKENDVFLRWFGPMINGIKTKSRQLKDTTHVYKKCPHCNSMLRLPRRRGKHTVKCPRCAKEFKIRVIYN